MLGLSSRTVDRLVQGGDLPAIRISRRTRFLPEDPGADPLQEDGGVNGSRQRDSSSVDDLVALLREKRLPSPDRTGSPKESSLGKPQPLIAGFPKKSLGFPRVQSQAGFQLDPAEIREGRLDPKALNANEQFVRAVLPSLGLADLDAAARCCLRRGTGNAVMKRSKRGVFLYGCPCHNKGKGRPPADAYATSV